MRTQFVLLRRCFVAVAAVIIYVRFQIGLSL